MEGQLFEIGQAVTPADNSGWHVLIDSQRPHLLPKVNEIYHVREYLNIPEFGWCISLEELSVKDFYIQTCFAPAMGDDQLAAMLQEEEVEV